MVTDGLGMALFLLYLYALAGLLLCVYSCFQIIPLIRPETS